MKRFYVCWLADQEHYVVCEPNGTPLAQAAIVRGNLFRLTNGACEVHASGFSLDGDVLTLKGWLSLRFVGVDLLEEFSDI